MDAKRRLLQRIAIVIFATATTVVADSAEHSFGEAFFVSRRNDGSIELIGSSVTWLLLFLSMIGIGLLVHISLANRRATVLPDELVKKIRKEIKKNTMSKNVTSIIGVMFA